MKEKCEREMALREKEIEIKQKRTARENQPV